DLADRMQIGASSASKMSGVFEHLDGSTEALEKGFKQLRLAIVEASTGKGGAADAFQEMGIRVDQLRALRPEDQLLEIARGFETLPTPIDKTRVAQELFSKSGDEWIAVLANGTGAIKQYMDSIVALDDRGTAALDRAAKASSNFWRTIKTNFANTTGTVIADVFGSGDELLDLQAKLDPLIERLNRIQAQPSGRGFMIPRLESEIALLREQIAAIEVRNQMAAQGAALPRSFDNPKIDVPLPNITIDDDPSVAREKRYKAEEAQQQEFNKRRLDDIAFIEKEMAESNERIYEHQFDLASNVNLEIAEEQSTMWEKFSRQGGDMFYSAIRDGFDEGADGAEDRFRQMLSRMAADAAASGITDYLFGNTDDKDTTNDVGWIQRLFEGWGGGNSAGSSGGGGAPATNSADYNVPISRDNGGPLKAGQTAYIGTGAQPELFTAQSDGWMTPANKLGGNSTYAPTHNVYIGAGNAVTRAEVVQAIQVAQRNMLAAMADSRRRSR
ncbi:MAG TPA: hypothetical protein VK629_07505, partial [Steroidobacteraceae bacterium]|nr:hypothetical protein [Steroidobacteraceae bacterium]